MSSLVVPWLTSTASASAPVVTNYTDPSISAPFAIAPGPDGALWFTNAGNSSIGRITTSGVVTSYPVCGEPQDITAGPDGALWFTAVVNNSSAPGAIGRITTGGVVTCYGTGIGLGFSGPGAITAGPDGALWFTNSTPKFSSIGRITTSGAVTNNTNPSISDPGAITAGPDGALWFTNAGNNSIGRITTSGVVTSYTDPSITGPGDITAGPDGALWFTISTPRFNSIGRITTSGAVTNYTDPSISGPRDIAAGPDGALWFTNYVTNSIGRITTSGAVTNYTDPSISGPSGITAGPDGALWFTNYANNSIGRITTGSSPSPTTSVLIPSNGATLSGSTYLDASASNATSVEFRLFGGIYGYAAPVICTATPTIYGWLCSWNTATVPSGTYLLLSEAFGAGGNAFSSGVSVTVAKSTTVIIPANGATLDNAQGWVLDAVASAGATAVTFLGDGAATFTATPTIYGWIYVMPPTPPCSLCIPVTFQGATIQSVATYPGGVTVTSPTVNVTLIVYQPNFP